MVKGVSKRVIVIKSPDPKIFDEAIFIVKETVGESGVTQKEILRQAQQAADSYIRSNMRNKLLRLSPMMYALLGAVAAGLIGCAAILVI
ncbi:MAG: hypothetical protein IJG63_02205 [Oscillospiraceae bacterium]|nr:hypothetical protein [Oscillospiraceae bacterium]